MFYIPDVLQNFEVGNNGEVLIKTKRRLLLKHTDWDFLPDEVANKFRKMYDEMKTMICVMAETNLYPCSFETEEMLSLMKPKPPPTIKRIDSCSESSSKLSI